MKMRNRRLRLKRRTDAYDKTNVSFREKHHMTRRPGSLKK